MTLKKIVLGCLLVCYAAVLASCSASGDLALPHRSAEALTGSQLADTLAPMPRIEREARIFSEFASGNVPEFLRRFVEIRDTITVNGRMHTIAYKAAPDYVALGSDSDYFYTPMTPLLAQRVADQCSCMLPTRKMVDAIYHASAVKLAPRPIPPSPAMITVPIFKQHDATVRAQRDSVRDAFPLGALVGGTKKDVIISPAIYTNLKSSVPRPVVIYGWHQLNGLPIQPRFNGHQETYADYSHGIRLIQTTMHVDGRPMSAADVLKDSLLCALLSDEGVIPMPRYTVHPDTALSNNGHRQAQATPESGRVRSGLIPGFHEEGAFGEQVCRLTYPSDVTITIDAPPTRAFDPAKKTRLIFYALPNGNTTAQTIGKKMKDGDDWHNDIQHIGAQTRFLRDADRESNIVTIYLENSAHSWGSAWINKHADACALTHRIVDSVMSIFAGCDQHVTLSSHSGGGNFIFTYLDSAAAMRGEIERIVFLDSDYRYNDAYGDELSRWLKASPRHSLCVLAYNDSIALLNGKPFVSATGGTWYRTKMMKERLAQDVSFSHTFDDSTLVHRYVAEGGRVEILMKENPGREIFHTMQVERNGFIHSCLSGTVLENRGYTYFGPRAYTQWIEGELTSSDAGAGGR